MTLPRSTLASPFSWGVVERRAYRLRPYVRVDVLEVLRQSVEALGVEMEVDAVSETVWLYGTAEAIDDAEQGSLVALWLSTPEQVAVEVSRKIARGET